MLHAIGAFRSLDLEDYIMMGLYRNKTPLRAVIPGGLPVVEQFEALQLSLLRLLLSELNRCFIDNF